MAHLLAVELHVWAYIFGTLFSCLAIVISLFSLVGHLKYNSHPVLRLQIVRIVGMVPVYALVALLGLLDKNYTYAFDVARECYEAFTIYSFHQFLLAYVSKGKDYHTFITEYKEKDYRAETFFGRSVLGTGQYVFLKLFCTLIMFILSLNDLYVPGSLNFKTGYLYIAVITNFSQIFAMYSLYQFYTKFRAELADIKPFLKFMCIKAVVFFTFWQGILIAFLVKIGVIKDTQTYTTEQSSEGLQDFIICIEMFVASIVHIYAFPVKEFYNPGNQSVHYSSFVDHLLSSLWPYQPNIANLQYIRTVPTSTTFEPVLETSLLTQTPNIHHKPPSTPELTVQTTQP